MLKKDKVPFCCVPLQKHGHVRTGLHTFRKEETIIYNNLQYLMWPCPSVFFYFTEEVTYRWIYNEFPVFLYTDRRRFVSQKTGNLYISKVEAQDAGNYSCFVSSPVIGKSVFSKFIPLIPLPPDEGKQRRKNLYKRTFWKHCILILVCDVLIFTFFGLRWEKVPSRHQGEVPGHYCHAGL